MATTSIEQSLPSHFILQANSNRFSQPSAKFPFSQFHYHRPSSDDNTITTAQRQSPQIPIRSNQNYPPSDIGQLLREHFDEQTSQINLDLLSPSEQNSMDK